MTHSPNPWEGHIDDERLVDLSLGETPTDVESAHLAECSHCRESMASLVRTISVTRDASSIELVPPQTDLWPAIEAGLDDEPTPSETPFVPSATSAPAVEVPWRAGDSSRTRGRRPALGWLAAACAAGVLLGTAGTVAASRITSDEPDGSDSARIVATAQLDTLDTGQWLGAAEVSEKGDDVTLQVDVRDIVPGDGFVEVWLINRDGKRLVSVGVLRDGAARGTFPISQRLLDEGYVVVDLSREKFDDKPQHSGDSIVRGSLTTRT